MKTKRAIFATIALVSFIVFHPFARAATSVNSANPYSYGANMGWMNWTADTNHGAVIAAICSGYIYSANVGWINLGNGSPTNGSLYQNLSANDFGVNRDAAGNLRGYAYGANIGWLAFENIGAPQMNLTNGILSGYVWSANAGWISLSNAVAYVQTAPTMPPIIAPAGLVAWWPANGNAVDVIGGNNGTLTNGVGYGAGEVVQAFNLTNNHAGVFIGNLPALQLQNLTIEAWVKRATTAFVSDDPSANGGAAAIFYFGSQGYGMGMHSDGAISLTKIDVDDVNDDAYGARVTDTNWHHVAVTKFNTVVSFYIDGVAYPAISYNSTFQFITPAAIGTRGDNINANNNDSFAGAIDELSIYNRALTPSEILSIYNAGSAGKTLNPAPPALNISSFGSNLTIAWPATGNYTIQQTTNLADPASWVSRTNLMTTNNGTNSIIIVPSERNLFFRLSSP